MYLEGSHWLIFSTFVFQELLRACQVWLCVGWKPETFLNGGNAWCKSLFRAVVPFEYKLLLCQRIQTLTDL